MTRDPNVRSDKDKLDRIRAICDLAHTDYYDYATDAIEDIEWVLSLEVDE